MSVYDPNDPLAQLDPSQVPHAAPDQMADVAPESPVVPVAELPTTGLYLPGENTSDLGVNVNQAPPAVGPTVSSSDSVRGTQNLKYNPATGKVDGDFQVVPGKTETTQVAQPTRTSSGTSTSVSASSSGPDMDIYDRLDQASAGSAKNQTDALTRRNQLAQQAMTDFGREAEANIAATQELQAQFDDTAANIENQRLQEIETTKAKVQEIHDLAKQEVTMEMEKWKMEREQLSRLIAMDPVTEMYKGFSGIGMNMTTAVGSYLTALGVQNDLGAQMNQWVDRAIQSHQNRIAGQKDKMTATEKAIAQVWDNSRNEQEARLKITQLGLQALDTKLEVEKLKTSSKIKRSQIKVKQAEVRMQIATNAYKQQAEYAKDFTNIRMMEAQRSAALAQASRTRQAMKFDVDEHNAKMAKLTSQLPENLVPVYDSNGKLVLRQAIVNNPQALGDLRQAGERVNSIQQKVNKLQDLWAASGVKSFKDFVKTNTEATQLFNDLAYSYGKEKFGAMSKDERAIVESMGGATSGSFTDAGYNWARTALGFSEELGKGRASFANMILDSARRDYDSMTEQITVPLDEKNQALVADTQNRMNQAAAGSGMTNRPQAGKAAGGQEAPADRVTRAVGMIAGSADGEDVRHNMGAITQEVKAAKHRYDNLRARLQAGDLGPPGSPNYVAGEAALREEESFLRNTADSLSRFQAGGSSKWYQSAGYDVDPRKLTVRNPDQFGFDPNLQLDEDSLRKRGEWATGLARDIYSGLPKREKR